MNLVCKTVALCLLLSTMGSPALAQSPETNARIQRVTEGLLPPTRVAGRDYEPQTLEDLMAETGVPAVSIAVINEGRIEWTRAWGLADAASGQIATTDTLFQAASISKAVVATAALDMVEDGLLSLDAPVNDALRGWTIPENDLTEGHPVTLRHLLAHTSGLTVGGFPGYPEDAPVPNVEQILDGVPPANTPRVEVDQTPGSARRYSGGGFTVLQLLMSQHENLAFPALIQTRVLSPAGMIASAFDQPLAEDRRALAATGYDDRGEPVAGRFHTYPELAAAGLWTTPTDLARWVLAISDAFNGRSNAILERETARAMLTRDPWGQGLGLVVRDAPELEFSHGGANEGYRALVVGLPDRGQGVVIMTNGDNGQVITSAVVLAVAEEYGWSWRQPRMITPVPLPAETMGAFAGQYDGTPNLIVTVAVSPDGDSLLLTVADNPALEFIPQGDDGFIDTAGRARLTFERDEDGTVTAAIANGQRLPRRHP
ncbi:serine hydrolase domain-containing protein [Brevundimonas aveniformis]|uniref:serine hydrolase domain-containing protein n=1 Tax=Brevundimonas aveniformis TaxID=370977 RepID=UPI00041C9451|nr:serine hydrolase domain-containing protein [Brevundimonas aveniformis]